MHAIQVTYDPTTRRISLIGRDNYGGATTDVNSVSIEFTGIEAFGNDFIARVDFAVPIKKDDYTIEHPFILLEQDNDTWSAVIPNAVLMAAKDTKKLPFQLILANDSQVINSRNAITLDITPGIDSLIPGSDLPEYEAPEWPLPEEITYTEEDVHTVEVTYDPATRTLTTPSSDMYGGATIDTRSVRINVSGIVPTGVDFSARLDFAAPIRYDEGTVIKPFVVLERINNTWCAIIPQAILMAVKETKKLPFQLVTRHGDTVINSRNAIVLEITRAINAMESIDQTYSPYVMYRNDTWEWIDDFHYDVGSVVSYEGHLYIAIQPSIGQEPSLDSEYWRSAGGAINLNGQLILDPIFYAPLDSGTNGQVLVSKGELNAPVWATLSYTAVVDCTTNEVVSVDLPEDFINHNFICAFFDAEGAPVYPAYRKYNDQVIISSNVREMFTMQITMIPTVIRGADQ